MKSMVVAYAAILMSCMLVTALAMMTMSSSYSELMQQNLEDAMLLSVDMLRRDRAASLGVDGVPVSVTGSWADYGTGGGAYVPKSDFVPVGREFGDSPADDSMHELGVADDEFTARNAQFKKDFVQYLTANLDSRITGIDVSIYGADYLNGILSVELVAHFRYPAGAESTVSTYKTVILDRRVKN